MFSKTTLPVVGALISAVMASPIERAVADAIAANAQSEILFAPLPLVGTGNRLAKSAGQRTDFGLVQKDDLYWSYPSEKLLANATFTAKPAYKIANEQNFGDLVSSIDCADPKKLKVQLKNAASVADAKKAWSWVNQAEANTLVYVTESGACGGTYGRQPFYVTSADYEGNTATLDVRSAGDWKEFAEDASVHIGASNVDDESSIDKRLSYSDNVKISLEHTFTKHFYDADIGPAHLSVDCSDCGTFGSLLLDIKVSTGDGFEASATTADNVHARLAIAATASAAIKIGHSTGQLTIAEVPLPTFKVGGVVKIKPEIALKLSLSITDIAGSITAVVGAQLSIPDGQGIALGKGVDSIEPQFSVIGPTISGKVDVSARVGTLFTVNLSGDILGLDLIAGIDLNAPYLAATAGVYVGTPTACDPNSSIKLGLTVGGTLDTYYGKGKKGDQPHKKNIYNKDIPLIDECYPI